MDILKKKIAFKGTRTYLHGTDLFDEMRAIGREHGYASASSGRVTFAVNNMIEDSEIEIAVSDAPIVTDSVTWVAKMSLLSADESSVYIAARPAGAGQEAGLRKPYDEEKIVSQCEVSGRRVSSRVLADFSLIEQVVPLNKHLRMCLHTETQLPTNWLFVRADFKFWPETPQNIEITSQTDAPARIYKSTVSFDGIEAGEIYFMEAKK